MSATMHRSTRLRGFYGSCSKEQLVSSQKHPYVRRNCFVHCIQAAVQRSCSCIDGYHLFAMSDLEDYEFCRAGNLSDLLSTLDDALARTQCVSDVISGLDYDNCKCEAGCDEISYESDVSQNIWPHETHHLMIYQWYILNTVPDNQRFIEVQPVSSLPCCRATACTRECVHDSMHENLLVRFMDQYLT